MKLRGRPPLWPTETGTAGIPPTNAPNLASEDDPEPCDVVPQAPGMSSPCGDDLQHFTIHVRRPGMCEPSQCKGETNVVSTARCARAALSPWRVVRCVRPSLPFVPRCRSRRRLAAPAPSPDMASTAGVSHEQLCGTIPTTMMTPHQSRSSDPRSRICHNGNRQRSGLKLSGRSLALAFGTTTLQAFHELRERISQSFVFSAQVRRFSRVLLFSKSHSARSASHFSRTKF